jgi:hypothetical protein
MCDDKSVKNIEIFLKTLAVALSKKSNLSLLSINGNR